MTAAESGIKRMSLSGRSLRRQALKLEDNRLQLQPHSISWSRKALLPVVAWPGVPDKNRIYRVFNLLLTWIWDVPSSCLDSMKLQ